MALITGTSDLNPNLQGYYDRNLLENYYPKRLHVLFLDSRPLPRNMGERINMRRIGKLAAATTPLTHGQKSTGSKLTSTDIWATLKEYGDYITYDNWIQEVGLDRNILDIGQNEQAEQMADTEDLLARNVMVAGTTVRYAGGVTARASVVTAIANSDVDSALRTLEGNNAKKIAKMLKAGSGIGTQPIDAAYIMLTHTHSRYDCERLTGFIPVREYARQDSLSTLGGDIVELGAIGSGSIRVLLTTNGKIWPDGGTTAATNNLVTTSGTNADVYASLILARGFGAHCPLQKGNVKNIIHQLGSAGSADPMNQVATTAWRMATTHKITNEDNGVRIEHGVTSL